MKKEIIDIIKSIARDQCYIPYTDEGNGSAGPGMIDPDAIEAMLNAGDFDDADFEPLDRDALLAAYPEADPKAEWLQISYILGSGNNPYRQTAWIWRD